MTRSWVAVVLGWACLATLADEPPRFGRYTPRIPPHRLAGQPQLGPTELVLTVAEREQLQRCRLLVRPVTAGLAERIATHANAGRGVLVTYELTLEVALLELAARWQMLEREQLVTAMARLATALVAALPSVPAHATPAARAGLERARAYAVVLHALGMPRESWSAQQSVALVLAELQRITAGTPAWSPLFGRELNYARWAAPAPSAIERMQQQLAWAGLSLGATDDQADAALVAASSWAQWALARALIDDQELSSAWRYVRALLDWRLGGELVSDPRELLVAVAALSQDATADDAPFEPLARRPLVLIGLRRLADFNALAALAYPHVGTAAQEREDPSGIDLAAALGSPLARAAVVETHGHLLGLTAALLSVEQRLMAWPPLLAGTQVRSTYDAGLDIIAAVIRHGGCLPAHDDAARCSQARALAAALGAWLRLRCRVDTPRAFDAAPTPAALQLEPAPAIYARLAALLSAASEAGDPDQALGLLSRELTELAGWSARILDGEPLAARDQLTLAAMVRRWLSRPIHPASDSHASELLVRTTDVVGGWLEVHAGFAGGLELVAPGDAAYSRRPAPLAVGVGYAYAEARRRHDATETALTIPAVIAVPLGLARQADSSSQLPANK
jgi:hypothetical protein